MNKTLKLYSSN